MSEVYMDIDLLELAENASDKFAVYDYVITMRKRNRITNAEFMAVYDYMITVMEGLTSKRDVALSMSYGAYTDGILTRQNFVKSFDAMKVAWNDYGSDADNYITQVVDYYYNGSLTLSEVKKYWSIGDKRTVRTSYMSATYVSETHSAQNVSLIIVDFDHDTLGTSINGKTKALMTIGFSLSENGSTTTIPYTTSNRYNWCNYVCSEALPTVIKQLMKTVNKQTASSLATDYSGNVTYVTTQNKVFIPTCYEFCGYSPSRAEVMPSGYTFYGVTLGGTQYTYYKTNNVPKNMYTTSFCAGASGGGTDGWFQVQYNTGKNCSGMSIGTSTGLMPHFCI